MSDTKRKIRFNILDAVVVLLIAVLVIAYVMRSNLFNSTLAISESVGMEVSVRVEDVRDFTVSAFSVGDNIYDRETGNLLGTITDITANPSYKTVELDGSQTEDGASRAERLENPGRYNLYITFVGTGKISEEGAYINGNKLVAPNSGLAISTQKVITDGRIVSVTEKVSPAVTEND